MDFRVGRSDSEPVPWSVLSDLTITMVLVLVLFVALQFLATFRERFVNAQLMQRQNEVKTEILQLGSSRVQIDSLAPDRQKLVFDEAVLFETCRASLKPTGDSLLSAIGVALSKRQHYFESVSIEGHTDTVPISGRRGCSFNSNWDLSSARATAVVSLLSGNAAIENAKLASIGKSEYHPIGSELAQNRRIELVILYDRSSIVASLHASDAP